MGGRAVIGSHPVTSRTTLLQAVLLPITVAVMSAGVLFCVLAVAGWNLIGGRRREVL